MGYFRTVKKAIKKDVANLSFCLLLATTLLGSNGFAEAHNGRSPRQALGWPPPGQKVECPVIRDTFVSAFKGEEDGNNGGSSRLKVKGSQEFILFDIEPRALEGKVITGALLHLRSASPNQAPLARLGVSSVASEWCEGISTNYRPEPGRACFSQAEFGRRDWAYPGSTVTDVVLGRGHTLWRFADCSGPDQDGWQTCAVEPDVVGARIAGLSHGFCASDEVGNVWSIEQGKFKYTYLPNRFVFSREKKDSAPWMEVWINGEDRSPPESVTEVKVETVDLPSGEVLLRWKTPQDQGGGKVLGFKVSYMKHKNDKPFPRYLIPMAGAPGQEVLMHIQDMPFGPGEIIFLTIRAVDSSGNVSEPFTAKVATSAGCEKLDFPKSEVACFEPEERLPSVGGVQVGVVDLLDKIDPRTGDVIPQAPAGYKGGNHIYSARERLIRLQAARNEHVAFQINLSGKAEGVKVHCVFKECQRLKPELYEFGYVEVKDHNGSVTSILPDPLLVMGDNTSVPSSSGQVRVPDQTNHSLICEIYVPHEEPAGEKRGKLFIQVGKERIQLDIILKVWNFTLPNKLSFIPEMNAYGSIYPNEKGYRYYRLAHEHRTCINCLPYNWAGRPTFAPHWDEKRKDFDWRNWDGMVEPLLNGEAFKDLPRSREPLDVFYLPFNENWPISVAGHYTPSYWADEAFSRDYKADLVQAFRSFASHCREKGWADTIFQFFLNNKVFYRNRTPKSSAPWIFDEPVNTQDFWALRWYGLLWREGVDSALGNISMWYRCDISQGEFARNLLQGIMDLEYVGGNTAQKTRMKREEKVQWPDTRFSEYGSANAIEESNTLTSAWCLCAWSRGAMGVLPWQTIGNRDSWKVGDKNALFYPADEGGAIPSVRLKAFRRGQQDIEYLTILGSIYDLPRYALTEWLKKASESSIGPEVGFFSHDEEKIVDVRPPVLWEIRIHLGELLSSESPPYRRSYASRKSEGQHSRKLPRVGYVTVSPRVEPLKPQCDAFVIE